MDKKCVLVVTSIGNGAFAQKYANKIRSERTEEHCSIIVIPDRKTKRRLFEECGKIKKQGIKIECPTVDEQDRFLKKLGAIKKIIPYNSDNRRNIGYLMALERGCDFLISIDDDNYCRQKGPFFKEHAVVCGGEVNCEAVESSTGWYNICRLMNIKPDNIYPRGFPYKARFKSPEITRVRKKGEVHLNAGLWLKDPDVDAITWIVNPPKALSFKGKSVFLGNKTWSPINTQNTALNREAVISYYFVKMGHSIKGMVISRYDDIFSGYFCQKCIRHLGYHIRAGSPVVDHIRNSHDYLRDSVGELACFCILDDIVEWLREVKLSGSTYGEAYLSLASRFEDAVEGFSGFMWNKSSRKFFHKVARYMRIWVRTVNIINGS